MNWWRRKPSRPTDSDPDLADIRRDLVWKFGEDIAYAIWLTGKDQTPARTPTWDTLVSSALMSVAVTRTRDLNVGARLSRGCAPGPCRPERRSGRTAAPISPAVQTILIPWMRTPPGWFGQVNTVHFGIG